MVITDSRSGFYDVTDDVMSRIIIVGTLGLNISETRPDSGMVSTYSQYELAYGLSIAHGPDNVT